MERCWRDSKVDEYLFDRTVVRIGILADDLYYVRVAAWR